MQKQSFQYTIETPNDPVGGDVYTSDLEKAEEFCTEMGEEHGYSCVRSNITEEIVFDYGNINLLLIILLIMSTTTFFYVQWRWLRKVLSDT